MDNCFTGRRDRSRQTTEKVILYKYRQDRSRVYIRQVSPRAYFLSTQNDNIASFFIWHECTDMFFAVLLNAKIFKDYPLYLNCILISSILPYFWSIMASPGQRRGTCGHAMAMFDSHTKCAYCRDKGIGQDACVEKKDCAICNSFTEDQKLQLATPTYKARKDKELQKKNICSPCLVDPSTVTVVGKVESGKGDSSDRGETPTKKKASHKSPKKISKPPKNPDFQSDLKQLDDKWAERFTLLEALFLSKTFQLPVEPVQSSNVVVSEKPFLPPVQQSTSQKPDAGVTGKKKKAATQPVEAPGVKKLRRRRQVASSEK